MAIGITNNTQSFGKQLNRINTSLSKTLQELASAKKINSAKDNAAGIAIVERFAAQITGAGQGFKNISDGISLTQTAEGFTSQISDFLQRARELTIQSGNPLLNGADRTTLQNEFDNIKQEINRVVSSAEFNGQPLLNQNTTLQFQLDANATDNIDINTVDLGAELTASGFFAADITSPSGTQAALGSIDTALDSVNNVRGELGALYNRFESIGRNLLNKQENLEASKSRILDTDFAKSSSELTKNLLLNDAATALRGQANASSRNVLNLLSA